MTRMLIGAIALILGHTVFACVGPYKVTSENIKDVPLWCRASGWNVGCGTTSRPVPGTPELPPLTSE